MATPLYPGITTKEIDLSTTVSISENSTYAALAGNFQWGPCEEITLISDEATLVSTFGKPNANTYIDYFSASNFLLYSTSLKVSRVVDTGARNAASGNTAVIVKNTSHYEQATLTNSGAFIARFPGSIGNSLFVAAIDSSGSFTSNIHPSKAFGAWDDYFQSIPGTSTYASNLGGSNDEMHIIVFDEDGLFSGTPGTVLEKYSYASKAIDNKQDNGTANNYKNLINSKSQYIRIGDTYILGANSTAISSATFTPTGVVQNSLSGGIDVNATADSAYINSADLFTDKKTVDISHFITSAMPSAAIQEVVTLAENRGDVVAYVSPTWACVTPGMTQSAIVSAIATYKNSTLNINSSYVFFDNNWKWVYDKYNDVYRWVPCNGDVAGLSSRTDLSAEPWFSPAGYNRGILRNAPKLSWTPNDTSMGALYNIGVNSIVFEEGSGALLFGDKTALNKPSAFDRINVRKLFNVLKRKIGFALKPYLFEINDSITQTQARAMIDAYMAEIKARRGIYAWYTQCDSSNNTSEVIDSNGFVVSVWIQPSRSINFIELNLIATRTGVSFTELLSSF